MYFSVRGFCCFCVSSLFMRLVRKVTKSSRGMRCVPRS